MKQYISEARAIYEDNYHGQFSKNLAEWAINNMQLKDQATGQMRPIRPKSVEETMEILKQHGVELPEEYIYTAWYLYHMAVADYRKTCKNDEDRANFVEETLMDPDGMPENVLDCFVAKMCNAGKPIYWEQML
jgi:hypothetical protein